MIELQSESREAGLVAYRRNGKLFSCEPVSCLVQEIAVKYAHLPSSVEKGSCVATTTVPYVEDVYDVVNKGVYHLLQNFLFLAMSS